ADTRVFDAAEWRAQVAHHPTIDPDDAGLERGRDAMRAVEIARPERSDQAIPSPVRARDGLGLVIERRDRDDRAEDFLLVRATTRRETLDHRRRDEPAVCAAAVDHCAFTAAKDRAALVARGRDGR